MSNSRNALFDTLDVQSLRALSTVNKSMHQTFQQNKQRLYRERIIDDFHLQYTPENMYMVLKLFTPHPEVVGKYITIQTTKQTVQKKFESLYSLLDECFHINYASVFKTTKDEEYNGRENTSSVHLAIQLFLETIRAYDAAYKSAAKQKDHDPTVWYHRLNTIAKYFYNKILLPRIDKFSNNRIGYATDKFYTAFHEVRDLVLADMEKQNMNMPSRKSSYLWKLDDAF